MTRGPAAGKLGFLAIGISLAAIGLSMTPLAGGSPARAVLLGAGLAALTGSLILLQLRFFREGDAKNEKSASAPAAAGEASAPPALKNPRQRLIWSGMERTRRLMNRKEEEARDAEMRREKTRLGLPDEEDILYMGDRSWLSLWPVALISAASIAASTALSGVPALLFLAAGLAGLGLLTAVHRLTRYYFTNYRVLVRRRPLLGGSPRWRTIHYPDVRSCSARRMLARGGLRLEGNTEAVNITGLNPAGLETARGILRKRCSGATAQPDSSHRLGR